MATGFNHIQHLRNMFCLGKTFHVFFFFLRRPTSSPSLPTGNCQPFSPSVLASTALRGRPNSCGSLGGAFLGATTRGQSRCSRPGHGHTADQQAKTVAVSRRIERCLPYPKDQQDDFSLWKLEQF